MIFRYGLALLKMYKKRLKALSECDPALCTTTVSDFFTAVSIYDVAARFLLHAAIDSTDAEGKQHASQSSFG